MRLDCARSSAAWVTLAQPRALPRRPAAQVYVPLVNGVLLVLCVAVVAGFRDTVALGKAYGLAGMATGKGWAGLRSPTLTPRACHVALCRLSGVHHTAASIPAPARAVMTDMLTTTCLITLVGGTKAFLLLGGREIACIESIATTPPVS